MPIEACASTDCRLSTRLGGASLESCTRPTALGSSEDRLGEAKAGRARTALRLGTDEAGRGGRHRPSSQPSLQVRMWTIARARCVGLHGGVPCHLRFGAPTTDL